MKRWLAVVLTAVMLSSGVGSSVRAAEEDANTGVTEEVEETEKTMEAGRNDEVNEPENGNSDSDADENEKTDENLGVSEDISNTDDSEADLNAADSESEATEEDGNILMEEDPEIGDKANSWRYSDGKRKEMQEPRASVYAYHPNATKTGIDVSQWQGNINWEEVKAAGISFVLIRCGWGMDETGQDDIYFERNVSECERLGIPYGVYLYSYATNTDRALSEAEHVLRLVKNHNLTYPVYYDMEDDSTIGSDLGAIAETFCSTVKNAGYAVGVYANLNWWNNYLTDSRFSKWHRWVAQYNSTCDYQWNYDIWQYTAEGSVQGITGNVDMNYQIGYPADHGTAPGISAPNGMKSIITYKAHVSDVGWMGAVSNGTVAGSIGLSHQLEAFSIEINDDENLGVQYQAYVENAGWQPYVSDGAEAGTTGQNKKVEAIRIKLTGNDASKYNIFYRTYVANKGWMDWTKNGSAAGTVGYNYRIEAFQIMVLPIIEPEPGEMTVPFLYCEPNMKLVSYAHCSEIGWQDGADNGDIIGTTGRNLGLEAFYLKSEINGVQIKYSSYTFSNGWQKYVANGEICGTTGQNTPIEAVKFELTGDEADNYHIYYRVHISNVGWLDWTADGAEAGNIGYHNKIEAIQVIVLPAGSDYAPVTGSSACLKKDAEVSYTAHVQDIGWQNYVTNGETAGTTGQDKQIEAIKIQLSAQPYSGEINYAAYIQDMGWQKSVSSNKIAGTVGENRQIEAIKIQLTGEMANHYDIYYRVHASEFGWLGWAKNGESAGSQGYARQVEALEICLVKKGAAAPGSTDHAFIKPVSSIVYQAHVQNIGWQEAVSNGTTAGTTGRNLHLEALKIQLANQEYGGGITYKAHVSDIGWQKAVTANKIAGTVGMNKGIEAVSIQLTGEMKEHYDIYYRIHASEFGWLGWAKNGENAGSQGYARHAEAIEIRLVKKGGDAPGSTAHAFYIR